MASINYLIPDMYRVLRDGKKIDDQAAKQFGERMANLVVGRLSPDRDAKTGLRMSEFGTPCERSLWYKHNKPDAAEPLEPWVLFKFLYGDLIEELALFLAEQSGHTVEGRQDTLEVNGVVGHRDAVIDGVVVDVKSANSRSFDKFKEHRLVNDDPFGYVDQLSLYLYASKDDPLVKVKNEAAFLAVDKEMGHMVLDSYRANKTDYVKAIEEKKAMIASPAPPPKPYKEAPDGASGNMKLGLQCSYCRFKNECWKESNDGQGLRTFIYSTGPRYLTKVVRQPDVIEKVRRTG